ncbi:hypothetical protein RHA65_11490 [Providencia rettgeri]|uniref:hypothetical protein n=1 Tax=Providencia TaxID=586 RepID=UPI001B374F39|nr:hypothetical protein [Providencia rettgeri]MBQ0210190.1 hypothetical protein [Providencia rettgeri]MDR9615250.1 hypothetical protein [Providencia rettgeri]
MTENTKLAIDIAKKLRLCFDSHYNEIANNIDFQFKSFPNNSCEGASALLGGLLRNKLNTEDVFIVNIYSQYLRGEHYFVEFEGLYYDLTFDQFGVDKKIIIAEDKKYLDSITTNRLSRMRVTNFLDDFYLQSENNKFNTELALKNLNYHI